MASFKGAWDTFKSAFKTSTYSEPLNNYAKGAKGTIQNMRTAGTVVDTSTPMPFQREAGGLGRAASTMMAQMPGTSSGMGGALGGAAYGGFADDNTGRGMALGALGGGAAGAGGYAGFMKGKKAWDKL